MKEFVVVYSVVCNKVIKAPSMAEARHIANNIRAGDEHSAIRVVQSTIMEYQNKEKVTVVAKP